MDTFGITGPLWEEFAGHLWTPLKKTIDAENRCFIWYVPEQAVELTIVTPVICDAIAHILHCHWVVLLE